MPDMSTRVQLAHGDAWQEQGRLREPFGGGWAEPPGIRLMASGLPHAQWNNGDVTDPELVDITAVRDWYAQRDLPWGVRVPSSLAWSYGEHLFHKRLMGVEPSRFVEPAAVPGLAVRAAGPADLEAVLAIDSSTFESDPDVERPWIEPHLTAARATVALAVLDGVPVGTAYSLRTDGRAGAALYVAGVGVLPTARRRGVGAAMSGWLVRNGFEAGAQLAHLHPDTDLATRVYARLGFDEVEGFEVFVNLA
jgi:GNAT superfamily N-acetyltransferase